ncbi:MAG: aminotransferase class I/II-fold pyridoxal phosphate-dependent enzyme [Candidatus Brocadiae bacterium]|nr:aminotransferase class I/II-fold pyridoxal phosphate-dependent enzyme [Candidatus Brocadiia bacterium]
MTPHLLRLSPHLQSVPDYRSGTTQEDAARRSGIAEVVKLSSNENALGPSRRAVAAVRTAARTLHLYPPASDEGLREKLAKLEGREYSADQIVCGQGASDVLGMIGDAFLEAGDEAILCPPTFPLYGIVIARRGARAVRVPLAGPRFEYDVEGILAAVTPSTRLVFLCSPVNPTGTLLTADRAARLMERLPRHVLAVFDESYRDFVDDAAASDARVFVRAGLPALALRSMSKSWGLAGLRVGWGLAPADVAGYLRRLRGPFAMGSLAIAGASAAADDLGHVARSRRLVIRERAWLFRELARRGLGPVPSQANFVLFQPGRPPETVYEQLLDRGVVVRPAAFFDRPESIRVTVGVRAQNRRFLDALDSVLSAEPAGTGT